MVLRRLYSIGSYSDYEFLKIISQPYSKTPIKTIHGKQILNQPFEITLSLKKDLVILCWTLRKSIFVFERCWTYYTHKSFAFLYLLTKKKFNSTQKFRVFSSCNYWNILFLEPHVSFGKHKTYVCLQIFQFSNW